MNIFENEGDSTAWHSQFQRVAYWLVLLGSVLLMGTALIFTFYFVWYKEDFRQIMADHFSATVGLPAAAVASLAVVMILQGTSGPIKVSGFGVTFEGASGPIIFWILCFLAIATSIKLLG